MNYQKEFEKILKGEQKFEDFIINNYDSIKPREEHYNSGFIDGIRMMESALPKLEFLFFKKLFNCEVVSSKYTGDEEEPSSTTLTLTWKKEIYLFEGKHNFVWNKMWDYLKYSFILYNCCDRVYNPDFKETYMNPTPDSWAFDQDNSFMKETDSFYIISLTFNGHYHS